MSPNAADISANAMHLAQLHYNRVMVALCIWREARGESQQARRGILHVISNRMDDRQRRWPWTYVSVILQAKQFSSFSAGDPNAVKFPHPDDQTWQQCCEVVIEMGSDPTHGANMYHSGDWANLPERSQADFPQDKITARIGAFTFYKV